MIRSVYTTVLAGSTIAMGLTLPKIYRKYYLEKKVGMAMMIHCDTIHQNADSLQRLFKTIEPAGIILYPWCNHIDTMKETRATTQKIKALAIASGITPPLIAIDQEGGRVDRIQELSSASARKKATIFNDFALYQHALSLGKSLYACGIDINFGPVVDIQSNEKNTVIGDRAFGISPYIVKNKAAIILKAYGEVHLLGAIKHWPGHGDTDNDSHLDISHTGKTIADLEICEISPFRYLAKKTHIVMAGHIIAPALDPHKPASLSKPSLDYLKTFFHGTVISDSLTMQGVLKEVEGIELTDKIAQAAIQAINAGCDQIIIGGKNLVPKDSDPSLSPQELIDIHHKIVDAVKKGELPLKRLIEANKKIKSLQKKG